MIKTPFNLILVWIICLKMATNQRCDLQNPFANRLRSLDQHRRHLMVVVHQLLEFLFRAAQICLIRCRIVGRSCLHQHGSSHFLDVRNSIGQTVLWCSIRYDASQKSGRTAPWEDPQDKNRIYRWVAIIKQGFDLDLPFERHHKSKVTGQNDIFLIALNRCDGSIGDFFGGQCGHPSVLIYNIYIYLQM